MSKPIYVTEPSLPPLEEFIPCLEKIWANKWLTNNGEFHKVVKTTEIKFWESDEEFLEFCAEAEKIIKNRNTINPPTLAEMAKYCQQEETFFVEWRSRSPK